MPSVTLSASYGEALDFDSRSRLALFGLSLPLPFWNRREGDLEAARADIAKQEAERERVLARIDKEVATAFRQFAAARQVVEDYVKQILPAQEQNVGLVEQGYRGGQLRLTEALLAQRDLIDVRTGYFEAIASYNAARVELERAAGARPVRRARRTFVAAGVGPDRRGGGVVARRAGFSALRARDQREARSTETARGGEAGHKKEDAHDEGDVITLTPERQQALGVKVEPAQARVAEARLDVTGKVAANPDRTAAITARTPGRVVKVQAQLGDTVEAGATLALVDSVEVGDTLGELAQAESMLRLARARAEQEKQLYEAKLRVLELARQQPTAEAALRELAQVELGRAKQEYLAALTKLERARADFERETRLVEGKIGARKDLLRAENDVLTATAELSAVAETIRLTARRELLEAETALQQARTQRDRLRGKLRLLGLPDSGLPAARRGSGAGIADPPTRPRSVAR